MNRTYHTTPNNISWLSFQAGTRSDYGWGCLQKAYSDISMFSNKLREKLYDECLGIGLTSSSSLWDSLSSINEISKILKLFHWFYTTLDQQLFAQYKWMAKLSYKLSHFSLRISYWETWITNTEYHPVYHLLSAQWLHSEVKFGSSKASTCSKNSLSNLTNITHYSLNTDQRLFSIWSRCLLSTVSHIFVGWRWD